MRLSREDRKEKEDVREGNVSIAGTSHESLKAKQYHSASLAGFFAWCMGETPQNSGRWLGSSRFFQRVEGKYQAGSRGTLSKDCKERPEKGKGDKKKLQGGRDEEIEKRRDCRRRGEDPKSDTYRGKSQKLALFPIKGIDSGTLSQ